MPKLLRDLVRFDEASVTVRHRLNGERLYLANPESSQEEVAAAVRTRFLAISLAVLLVGFAIYSALSTWMMGDYLNYRESPETAIYAPAFICSLVVTFMVMRYANIMYRSPLALSIPRELAGRMDREDAQLLYLAHANGELDSALESLRRSLESEQETGAPETREGPSDAS